MSLLLANLLGGIKCFVGRIPETWSIAKQELTLLARCLTDKKNVEIRISDILNIQ